MILFYDRQGQPLHDVVEWGKLLGDDNYQRIEQTATTAGVFWVSTVWLGVDHGHYFGPGQNPRPIIFETMVFDKRPANQRENEMLPGVPISPIMEQDRYSTEAEAIMGHAAMLKKYQEIEAKQG